MDTSPSPDATYRDREWLNKQYHTEEKTTTTIASEVGVSQPTITRWLARHGIETRCQSEIQTDGDTKPLRDETWLYEQYVENERSANDIADELGVTPITVTGWATEHGISIRTPW